MRIRTEHIKPLNHKLANGLNEKQIITDNLKVLFGNGEYLTYIKVDILNFKSNDLNIITENLKLLLKENIVLGTDAKLKAYENLFRIAKYKGLWFNANGFYLNGYRV